MEFSAPHRLRRWPARTSKRQRRLKSRLKVCRDRFAEASSQAVVATYEKHTTALKRDKLVLAEKRASVGEQKGAFEELFELAMRSSQTIQ